MVSREVFNIMWEEYEELRECSQNNDCILCRESNKDTICHLADQILQQQ